MGLGSNEYANQQAAAAKSSQRNYDIASQRVNALYDSNARQQDYADYLTEARKYFTDQVNAKQAVASRKLKFSLARSGLTGGSADVDANKTLSKDYVNALTAAESQAQSQLASLKSSDASTRSSLLTQAASGLTGANASTQAAQSMLQSLQTAKGGLTSSALGDLFSDTSDIYTTQQNNAALRKQLAASSGGLYGSS